MSNLEPIFNSAETEIDRLLENDLVNRHSYFQLKYFVIGREPTIQRKLWRCLEELNTRSQGIKMLRLEAEEINDNLELMDIELVKIDQLSCCDELDTKAKEIEKRKKQRKITALKESLKNTNKKLKENQEEALFFLNAFKSLEKIEKLKPYDDLESQTEYWNEKLAQELNLRLILQKPLDLELVKMALSMSDDVEVKREVVNIMEQIQKKSLMKPNEDSLYQTAIAQEKHGG